MPAWFAGEPSTLVHELHRHAAALPVTSPCVLGIHDWAWKKGHRYGTNLWDLNKREVVDLLPDREAGTVARWLREHPGTEIVSVTGVAFTPKLRAGRFPKLCK